MLQFSMGNCFCLNCLSFPGANKKEVICEKLRSELNNNHSEDWEESSDSVGVILKLDPNSEPFNSSAKYIAGGLRLANVSTYTVTEETRGDPCVHITQSCPEETGIPEELSDEFTSNELGLSAIHLGKLESARSTSLRLASPSP